MPRKRRDKRGSLGLLHKQRVGPQRHPQAVDERKLRREAVSVELGQRRENVDTSSQRKYAADELE
jgi:hypothetical protein